VKRIKINRRTFIKTGLIFVPSVMGQVVVPGPIMRTLGSSTSYLQENDLTAGSLPGGWSDQAGTPNWAYDATGLGMIGNTVLELDGTSATDSVDPPTFTGQTDFWMFWQYHPLARPVGGARELFRFLSGTTQVDGCEILTDTSGRLILAHNTINATTTTAMTLNTTYNCWAHWISETVNGANDGVAMICFSTSTTRPSVDGGGNGFISISNGTGLGTVNRVRLTAQFATTAGPQGLYAKFRVDDAAIGNNPP
jgi:hypothetical protein